MRKEGVDMATLWMHRKMGNAQGDGRGVLCDAASKPGKILSKYFLAVPEYGPVHTPTRGTLENAYSSAKIELEQARPAAEKEIKRLRRKTFALGLANLVGQACGAGALVGAAAGFICPEAAKGMLLASWPATHPIAGAAWGAAAIAGGIFAHFRRNKAHDAVLSIIREFDEAGRFLWRARQIVLEKWNGRAGMAAE